MPNTYTCLQIHVVFSTESRFPYLEPDLRPELWKYMAGVVRNLDGVALELGGVPDHFHGLISIPARLAVSELVNKIKSNSSRWLKEEKGLRKFAWQHGYSAFSVSRSQTERVRKYIRNQEEHHRTLTFDEEIARLLKHHGLAEVS